MFYFLNQQQKRRVINQGLFLLLPKLAYPAPALAKTSFKADPPLSLPLQKQKIKKQGSNLKNMLPIIIMILALFLFYYEFLTLSKMYCVSLKCCLKYLPSSNSSLSLYPQRQAQSTCLAIVGSGYRSISTFLLVLKVLQTTILSYALFILFFFARLLRYFPLNFLYCLQISLSEASSLKPSTLQESNPFTPMMCIFKMRRQSRRHKNAFVFILDLYRIIIYNHTLSLKLKNDSLNFSSLYNSIKYRPLLIFSSSFFTYYYQVILIQNCMRQSKASINSELKEIKRFTTEKSSSINYQKLISKQQEVIDSLRSEILLLKSYISLQKANNPFELNCSDISINSTCTSWNQSQFKAEQEESAIQINFKKYEKILKSITQILEIPTQGVFDEEQIVQNLKKLRQTASKKQEPIFVERIKEIKVPITVQKIVEKVVDKIVYLEKPVVVQKLVERPVFKEKIVQKFIERKAEENQESSHNLNKTFSEKNLRNRKNQETGYECRYEEKNKYESYKRNETGNNLIKKRGDYTRNYYRKDY